MAAAKSAERWTAAFALLDLEAPTEERVAAAMGVAPSMLARRRAERGGSRFDFRRQELRDAHAEMRARLLRRFAGGSPEQPAPAAETGRSARHVPATERSGNAPAAENSGDAPATETGRGDGPATERSGNAPAAESSGDAPATETGRGPRHVPATERSGNAPAAENSGGNRPAAQLGGNGSAVENGGGDAPAAERGGATANRVPAAESGGGNASAAGASANAAPSKDAPAAGAPGPDKPKEPDEPPRDRAERLASLLLGYGDWVVARADAQGGVLTAQQLNTVSTMYRLAATFEEQAAAFAREKQIRSDADAAAIFRRVDDRIVELGLPYAVEVIARLCAEGKLGVVDPEWQAGLLGGRQPGA